jgi:hypothetical protein
MNAKWVSVIAGTLVVVVLVVSVILSERQLFQASRTTSLVGSETGDHAESGTVTRGFTTTEQSIGTGTSGQVVLESYDWTNLELLAVRLRNAGPAPIALASFSLNGVRLIPAETDCPSPRIGRIVLTPQASCSIVLHVRGIVVSPNVAYELRLNSVTDTFVFVLVAGQRG